MSPHSSRPEVFEHRWVHHCPPRCPVQGRVVEIPQPVLSDHEMVPVPDPVCRWTGVWLQRGAAAVTDEICPQVIWREGHRIRRQDGTGYGDGVSDELIHQHIADHGHDPLFAAFAQAVLAIRVLERQLAQARPAEPS